VLSQTNADHPDESPIKGIHYRVYTDDQSDRSVSITDVARRASCRAAGWCRFGCRAGRGAINLDRNQSIANMEVIPISPKVDTRDLRG